MGAVAVIAGLAGAATGATAAAAASGVTGAATVAEPPPRSPAAVIDFRVADPRQVEARDRLLAEGEAALRRGDTAAALAAIERAAAMLHAADSELALVRAKLQAGDYVQALAFCAHTAGAHREAAGPAVLYAWLLQAGGQPALAQRVLADAGARLPGDALLAAVARELASPWPLASGALLERPLRLAPEAWSPVDAHGDAAGAAVAGDTTLPVAARVVASGVLLGDGRRALVPLRALAGAGRVWLRNGLGQTVEARVERALDGTDAALVALARTLALPAGFTLAPRDAFAGSVAYAVAYSAGGAADVAAASTAAAAEAATAATPAWPWLRVGFAGAGSGGRRRLGIDLPAGPRGGPVFDTAGRLAGVATTGEGGGDFLLPASQLRALGLEAVGAVDSGPAASGVAATPASTTAPTAAPPLPIDAIYERALRVALQVIVAP